MQTHSWIRPARASDPTHSAIPCPDAHERARWAEQKKGREARRPTYDERKAASKAKLEEARLRRQRAAEDLERRKEEAKAEAERKKRREAQVIREREKAVRCGFWPLLPRVSLTLGAHLPVQN